MMIEQGGENMKALSEEVDGLGWEEWTGRQG